MNPAVPESQTQPLTGGFQTGLLQLLTLLSPALLWVSLQLAGFVQKGNLFLV